MTIRSSAVAMVLLSLAAGLARAAEPPDWKTPNKDWLKSPVQWLMTDDEQKEFKKLRTDDERAAFARTFWEKRDPTPGTPENEFQIIFGQRVTAADKNYKDIIRQGSVTDLGRVFILLGPPTTTRKDSRYTYWDYEPSDVNGIKEKLSFSFAPVDTGILLRSPKTFETYVDGHPETRGIGWKIPQLAPQAGAGDLAQAPVKEHVEDTSPETQRQIPIIDAIAAKGSGPTDVPFQVTNDFYAAMDGSTLVVTTIEVPRDAAHGSGDQGILAFGRLAPASGEGRVFNLTGDLPFVPAALTDSPAGSFLYQARRNLKPGAWKQIIVLEDKVMKGQMGSLVSSIQVPDFGAKQFDTSTISLLSQFGKQDDSVGPDDTSKGAGLFSVGSFRIVPRANPSLTKTDTLAFYYQIYNPGNDATSGKPNLDATYTFYVKDATGWKRYRPPVVKPVGQVELYAIDIKDLISQSQQLPAEFKMTAKITDKTNGQSLDREIHFTVR